MTLIGALLQLAPAVLLLTPDGPARLHQTRPSPPAACKSNAAHLVDGQNLQASVDRRLTRSQRRRQPIITTIKRGVGESMRRQLASLPAAPRALIQKLLGGHASAGRGGGGGDACLMPPEELQRYLQELDGAKSMADVMMAATGWSQVAERNGVTVFKKWLPKEAYGSAYPCVKACAVVEVDASTFVDLLMDSSRVMEYNSYSRGRDDVAHLGPCTKIVWNVTAPPLTGRRHDFCTLMHAERRAADGAFVVTTTATQHAGAPQLPGTVRSEIVLGVTVVTPLEERRAAVTTVNHIVSAGVPAAIADRVSARNAADFIVNVSAAAARSGGGSGGSGGSVGEGGGGGGGGSVLDGRAAMEVAMTAPRRAGGAKRKA